MTTEDVCSICGGNYTEGDVMVNYHVDYKPEITTNACRGCNYAEYLIHHPEIKPLYPMERKMALVREWTIKNQPLIS